VEFLSTPDTYGPGERWALTSGGNRFDPLDPVFDINDIAHSLSQIVRCNGQVSSFLSVGTHSILTAMLMQDLNLGSPFEGLMHDAVEAYIGDVVAPFKALLPDFCALEDAIERRMRQEFGLPPTKTVGCKTADWLALFVEAFWLMPKRGAEFSDPHNLRPKAHSLANRYSIVLLGDYPGRSKGFFLSQFHLLNPLVRNSTEVLDSTQNE